MTFFKIYGKAFAILLVLGMLLSAAGVLFIYEWDSYGIAEDGAKTDFAGNDFDEGKPVIYAVNRRVLQHEKVPVKELATAQDGNMRSLSEYIHFYDGKGRELSGMLNTAVPGRYKITVFVKNPKTERMSKKDIVVLIDGRVV